MDARDDDANGRTGRDGRRRALAVGAAAVLAGLALVEVIRAPLAPPFDVAARRAAVGAATTPVACPVPPPPVRDLMLDSKYEPNDPTISEVDSERRRTLAAATAPILAYEIGVTRLSDAYVAARPPAPEAASCVLDWLARWADAGAMQGRETTVGGYFRMWGLVPVAAAYLKVRDEPSLDARRKRVVERWIAERARRVRDETAAGLWRGRSLGNLVAWAAAGVALGAVVADDPGLARWSRKVLAAALDEVAADGTLEVELGRGRRAFHYHLFALAPMLLTAETAARNGRDLFDAADGALHRLVGAVVRGLDDLGPFEAAAGAPQEPTFVTQPWMLAGLEIYHARYPDPVIAALLACLRPLRFRWLGGGTTLLFGTPIAGATRLDADGTDVRGRAAACLGNSGT